MRPAATAALLLLWLIALGVLAWMGWRPDAPGPLFNKLSLRAEALRLHEARQ